jgi:peptidoglycan/xylan/chitin deacetylase (PgdA/CDA1 family)
LAIWTKRTLVAGSAVLLVTLSACTVSRSHAAGVNDSPTPTVTAPSVSPTPPASPSGSPSASPTASPTPSQVQTTTINVNRSLQTGHGPAGSLLSTGGKGVALTFDDGPDPTYTPVILDLLKKYGIHATFCLVGFRARDYPALVQRIVAEGNTICNHSWQHLLDLASTSRTDAYILHDLQMTNAAIQKAVPGYQVKYFRAPGGNFTPRLVNLAKSLGMTSIYWAVDPRDWDFNQFGHGSSMVNHIIRTIESNTRPGSIILSHDLAKPDTMTAYKTLIPWLKARFVLIPLPT